MSEEKTSIEVNRQQYRQLDFLRLYRLCRSCDLLKRKRKMPIEYVDEDIHKNDKNARSSCRRLLRELILATFPDWEIKSNSSSYFIKPPTNIESNIRFCRDTVFYDNSPQVSNEVRTTIRDNTGILNNSIDGFIVPRLPYDVKIYFINSNITDNPYNTRLRSYFFKPIEDFYRCAKALLQYKEIFDYNYELVLKGISEFNEQIKTKVPVKAPIKVPTTPVYSLSGIVVDRINEQSRQRLSEIIATSAESGPRNTQQSFNRALQSLLERRNER